MIKLQTPHTISVTITKVLIFSQSIYFGTVREIFCENVEEKKQRKQTNKQNTEREQTQSMRQNMKKYKKITQDNYRRINSIISLTKSKKKITQKRINLHNSGKGAKFTRGRKWKLIYKEKRKSKKEAISREYYIKKNRTFRNKIKNENINSLTI